MPPSQREILCREIADTAAAEAAETAKAHRLRSGASADEADEAAREAFMREYNEVYEQSLVGLGS